MPLPSSGAISLNDMHVEVGGTSGTLVSINDSDIRGLINKVSGATMSFSEWYGASAYTPASFVGSATLSFPNISDWNSSNRLDLTGAGVQNGDLVVIAISADESLPSGTTDHAITGISGITTVYANPTSTTPQNAVYYGIWQSGDSNPYSPLTDFARDGYAVVGAIFRNTNTTLINSAIGSSTSGMPNPPSLASASGTTIIIATGHLDDDPLNMTAGTGYTIAGATSVSAVFNRCSTAIKYKITSTNTTEDPPAFGGSGSDYWYATTLRF